MEDLRPFSLFIFIIGAAACYGHTSKVVDEHLEKVFRHEVRNYKKLLNKTKQLDRFKAVLDKQYTSNLAKAEKAEKDAAEAKLQQEANEAKELQQRQENEKNQNDENHLKQFVTVFRLG